MDYIRSLLELITSKEELYDRKAIDLSLKEIASAWNRDALCEDSSISPFITGENIKMIDRSFLHDVSLAIKKIQDEGLISFEYTIGGYYYSLAHQKDGYQKPSISNLTNLDSIQDKIYLEIVGDIDAYLKNPLKENDRRIKLFISQDEGIYKNEITRKPNYPISGRRSKIITRLENGKKVGSSLIKLFNIDYQMLSKEIGEINDNFREKLKLEKNLIVSVETGGYKLNDESYDIKFIK